MSKKLKTKKDLWTLAAAILMLFILCRANIYGLYFFGYGFAFALIFNKFYSLIIVLCYFGFSLINQFSFEGLVSGALTCAILIIIAIVLKTNKKINKIVLLLFCAFSRVANIYFNFATLNGLLLSFIDLSIGLLFCFICLTVVSAFLNRGVQSFTRAEIALSCTVCTALFCGLANINLVINVSKLTFIFLILLVSVSIKHKSICIASFIAVANILTGSALQFVVTYFLIAFASNLISPYNKFLSASVACLVDALLGWILSSGLIELIPTLLAALIFLAIPKQIMQKISYYVSPSTSNLILYYYVNKKEQNIKSRLIGMSDVFKQMQMYYRDLLIGESNPINAAKLYAQEVKEAMCANCINRLACEEKNLTPCFEDLVVRAIDRGKVNLLDAPRLLSSNCTRLNTCLSHINQKVDSYVVKEKKNNEDNENKLNLCLQLAATSKIFAELSGQFSCENKTDLKKSKQTKDSLLKKQIVCKECMVVENSGGISEILLLVRNADVVNPEITKVCANLYNMPFDKKHCYQTQNVGWSIMCLIPGSRYELSCGYASVPKSVGDQNGDNFVYTKLNESKFLVAICDGMGHGQEANNASCAAINLIESYYKTGLSSNTAIQGVNNLFISNRGCFSTLDATVVDTITGELEFIKIGSTISIIKQSKQSKIVDVESLPLGVEEMSPTMHKYTLFEGDIVVLVSDGIADVFSSHEEFLNYVHNEYVINMQVFAESILEEAISRQPNRKDDMTVVAYKLNAKR